MINSFKSISNLAVFKDFQWDAHMRNKSGKHIYFKKINIIYGRNYSGKTTLSRIIRALDIGEFSNKYKDFTFEVDFTDGNKTTHNDLTSHGRQIRVFNSDFVKDNLSFIIDPSGAIEPFAVVGEDNVSLEKEIRDLNNRLGSDEEDKETGLYLKLKTLKRLRVKSYNNFIKQQKNLEERLKDKATRDGQSIKQRYNTFGDPDYHIGKLKKDIDKVLNPLKYTSIGSNEVHKFEDLIKEELKSDIKEVLKFKINFQDLVSRANDLITQTLGQTNAILELVQDATLNRWVQEGVDLHEGKRDQCGFCGNQISKSRWSALDQHFDEAGKRLSDQLTKVIEEIKTYQKKLDEFLPINKELFYSKFHNDLDDVQMTRNKAVENMTDKLEEIERNLETRKGAIFSPLNPLKISSPITKLNDCWNKFDKLRRKSNEYAQNLSKEKKEAQELLRLKEIFDFVNSIKYTELKKEIDALENKYEKEKEEYDKLEEQIKNILEMIEHKRNQISDMSVGAELINQYLEEHFGHPFLKLKVIQKEGEKEGFQFAILRDGIPAHNLSEGECSLVAFCYFMARLQDVKTKGLNPIIWIDDPISSLDSDHIFFVYSIIKSQIVDNKEMKQLFISTHNLEFLKYLQRLPSHRMRKEGKYKTFMISKNEHKSTILPTPKYLRNHITEFNYLFSQLYHCAHADFSDENHENLFYNFGNNTRKFLEIYLYFRYPDSTQINEKLNQFFQSTKKARMAERITNEYSHLESLLERGMMPIEIPEMKKLANNILDQMKTMDLNQYNSLIKSTQN